jgi:hypothetical protein
VNPFHIVISLILILLSSSAFAQKASDSLKIKGEKVVEVSDTAKASHSPKKAAILSAVLPGAGQIYNRKYWKLPIVYGGMATAIYLAIDYRKEYIRYREGYRSLIDNDPNTVSEFENQPVTPEGVRDVRDTYKNWMEMSFIAAGLVYVLNIVDASVDAHLMEFDVSDNLSIKAQPRVFYVRGIAQPSFGLSLSLSTKSFKK